MKNQEYKDMINSTVVPGILSFEEKNKLYQPINDFLNSETPEKLYRFRKCSERNISAFDQDILPFSPGYKMNDDFDGLLYFDKERIRAEFKVAMENKSIKNALYNLSQGTNLPAALQNVIPPQVLSAIHANTAQLDQEAIDNMIDLLYNYTMTHFDEELSGISHLIQTLKIASFSEAIDSAAMWGYYADDGKGFALSYDFRHGNYTICNSCATNQQCRDANNCYLLPIIYGDNRFDATQYAVWAFQQSIIRQVLIKTNTYPMYSFLLSAVPCPDEFMPTKALIHKAMVWSHEKEWRLVFTCNSPEVNQQEYPCPKKRPSAVYLGRNISAIHEKILRHIAIEKGIPVYKMVIRENESTYKLHPEIIG